MPSNWLYIDTNFPAFTGEESMEEKVTSIQDYMYLLVEQLRYTLHNLDLGNMNKTAKERWESAITEPIYAKIEDDEERILQLAIDAGALALRISDSEGNITQLQATAEGLQTRVSDNEGNITTLQQTAQGLATAIADQSGSISTLQQTASSLSTRISNTDGRVTTLQQTVNGFSLRASNDGEDSTISLMSNGVVVSSANIWFSGLVAFTDLERSNRYTIINADNITTGTIRANLVDVSNCFTLTSGGRSYGYMGCGYGSDGVSMTYGAILSGSNEDYYFIATNAGARMTGDGASIWCSGGCVHSMSGRCSRYSGKFYAEYGKDSLSRGRRAVFYIFRVLMVGCILPTPNAPGQRVFSRCAAPFFLEIRQYFKEKCLAQHKNSSLPVTFSVFRYTL